MKIFIFGKRLVAIIVAISLVCLVLVANLFIWFGLTVFSGRNGNITHLPAECGIVFGAAIKWDGTAGASSLRRVQTAADLYKDKQIERIFITGGRGEGMRFTEAEVMFNVAIEEGVDPSAITLEDKSTSTWENLLYTKPFIEDCTSIVAISDGYHLARIRLLANKQGWGDLQTYPSQELPTLRSELRNIVREILGMGYYTFF